MRGIPVVFQRFFRPVLICLLLSGGLWAQNYYVAPGGNDSNQGTLAHPYATIQKAANVAQPGDTVYVRAGIYREMVSLPRSGSAGLPITFQAYNGEGVQVTTTELLSGWTQYSGNIYKAPFASSIMGRNEMTIFVDGQWVHEAHWSDKGTTADLLERDTFATYGSGGTRTSIVDTDLIGYPNDLWNGAFLWVQSSNWSFETHRVTGFDGSTGRLTFQGDLGYDPQSGFEYLIFDSLDALDAGGEWYFDDDNNMLYLWAPAGGDPDNYTVEVKHRYECFDLNGHDYIQIIDIDMQGGDLDMSGSDHVLLQGAHIYAPDRRFGPEGGGSARSLVVDGDYNIIRDNEFDSVWLQCVTLSGAHNQIVNNYFHDIGYSNSGGACVGMSNCDNGNLISHNTFTRIGRGAIAGTGYHFVIQYNDFSYSSLLSEDNGVIAFGNSSYTNSIIHHNVFHHIDAYISGGVYVDNMGTDLVVHHNISYGNPAFGMKYNLPTAFMMVYNNTNYDSGKIDAWSPSSIDAFGSRFINNIYSSLDSDLVNGEAYVTNNIATTSGSHFVNAAAGDFRLVAGSSAVDAGVEIPGITDGYSGSAPDVGALELGETMWDFGHDFGNPPYPVYNWHTVPYTNKAENPGFEYTLSPWTTAAGTPSRIGGNAWNYKDDALAIAGNGALELKPGDKVQQAMTGLMPDTIYEFFAEGRMVYDIEIEDYDSKSGTFTTGNYRSEDWLGDLNTGEWLCYNNIDFGTTQAKFNRVEIGQQWDTFINVELRLDSPTGPVLTTLYLPGGDNRWYMARADIGPVTGTHDLYLIFLGNAASNAMIDKIRFLDTNTQERIKLIVKDHDGPGSQLSEIFGGPYWPDAPQKLFFRTGPSTTSATIALEKADGFFNGYIDQVVLVESSVTSLTQAPYANHDLPCTIEAEAYDIGDNGIAYSDDSAGNTGGEFRSDDVDIQLRDGGYVIGWTAAGEWLEYTVDVTAGIYDVHVRVATPYSGKSMAIRVNGNFLAQVDFPNTGDWGVFQTVTIPAVLIPGGTDQVLRLEMTTGLINLNWVDFELISTASTPDAPSGLQAVQTDLRQMDLNWNDNSSNESSFILQRKTGVAGSWADLVELPAGSTTYADSAITESIQYVYRVCAANGTGRSDYSNEAVADTIFDLQEFSWFAQCWNASNPLVGVIFYDNYNDYAAGSLSGQGGWSDFLTAPSVTNAEIYPGGGNAIYATDTDNTYRFAKKAIDGSTNVTTDTYYLSTTFTVVQTPNADDDSILMALANSDNSQPKMEFRIRPRNGSIVVTGWGGYYQPSGLFTAEVGKVYRAVAKISPIAGSMTTARIDAGVYEIVNGQLMDESSYTWQINNYTFTLTSSQQTYPYVLSGIRSNEVRGDDLLISTSWQAIQQAVNNGPLPDTWDCQSVDFDPDLTIDISDLIFFVGKWLEL